MIKPATAVCDRCEETMKLVFLGVLVEGWVRVTSATSGFGPDQHFCPKCWELAETVLSDVINRPRAESLESAFGQANHTVIVPK